MYDSVVLQRIIREQECKKLAENINNLSIKTLIRLYNSAHIEIPLVYTLLIKNYNFNISYKEIESESFGHQYTFL